MQPITRGYASTEFWVTVGVILLLIGISIGESKYGWVISDDIKQLLWGIVGASGIYVTNRMVVKSAKVKAMAANPEAFRGALVEPPVSDNSKK